ncbi:hypothetical protein Tco_1269242, partial [Tanacetum coccineum]
QDDGCDSIGYLIAPE